MRRNWKHFVIYTAFAMSVFSLTGCGSPSGNPDGEVTTAAPKMVLSIGTKDNLKSYDFTYETATPDTAGLTWDANNPDADTLIAIIAEVTGWNLHLAEPVSVSPGSFTIYFAEDSSIFTGTVDSSKTDFAITDRKELVTTILDSIVANMNAAYNESLTIYFAAADGGDISIPEAGITISSSEPYTMEAEAE